MGTMTTSFSWGNVFLLAEIMFNKSDAKIADALSVNRSTIYRHINTPNPNRRFEPAIDVYTALFKPPDNTPETEQQCYHKLCIALENDSFPMNFRKPKYKNDYRRSIAYLLMEADKTAKSAKKPQTPSKSSSDGGKDASTQEQYAIGQTFQEDAIQYEKEKLNLRELSEPQYYREYRRDSEDLELFKIYADWNYEPLDHELKKRWGSVCIADEFSKCIKNYGIESFLMIAPSELLSMKESVPSSDVADRIRDAVRFVDHMRPAIDYMVVTNKNQDLFVHISNFVALLKRYLRTLREHSINPDPFANEPVLLLFDDAEEDELTKKVYGYYHELRGRLKYLGKRLDAEK